jgi:hypothetical protein
MVWVQMSVSVDVRRSRVRDGLAGLFKPDTATWSVPRSWPWVSLAILVGAGVSLARTGGAGPFNSVWAEDGTNFIADAVERPWHALVSPLNGYFVLLPRLLTAFARLFGVGLMPAVMSVQAALVTAALMVFVFRASATALGGVLPRLVACTAMIAGPLYAGIPNNVATLQFALLYAAFWALLWVPRSRGGQIVALIVVGMAGITTILAALLAPIALLRWYLRRDGATTMLVIVLGLGACAQVVPNVLGLTHRGTTSKPTTDVVWSLGQYLSYGLPKELLGQTWAAGEPVWARIVAALILVAVVMTALVRITRPNWPVGLTAIGYSVLLFCFGCLVQGFPAFRYAYMGGLFLLAGIAALLRPRPGVGWAPLAAFTVLLALVSAVNYRYPPDERNTALRWDIQIGDAARRCEGTPPGQEVIFRTHPSERKGAAWYVRLPCRSL